MVKKNSGAAGNRRKLRRKLLGFKRRAEKKKRAAGSGQPNAAAGEKQPAGARPEVVVAGIGASAGGLAALKTFFRNVGEDSGLAWVVVVHLSPDHESHLPELLQPHVRMPVLQVRETTQLHPNRVYIIPPNANLSAIDTHLRLSPLEERRSDRAPIDHFFRTLAKTHDGHAIGVVLSGSGSDGTLGIKDIKAHGGLTVAQDPEEAEYDSMPQSAIATGFVDLVLPLASIPGAVTRFAHTEPRLPKILDDDFLEGRHRVLLQRIFAQVLLRTGRDFTRYKRSTIGRRIRRRMQLRHIEDLEAYAEFLKQNPDEVRALADDFLITVTSFFRDPAVFARLQDELIPAIYERKGPADEVRVWCVGCATGEEMYSIAMLLMEAAEKREEGAPRLQLLASDLHEESLARARAGSYPGEIEIEVSAERLKRFFSAEKGGYRIRRSLREAVVFAPHNLLGDPPFSRLDLVVCRNLLIYLQRDVQAEVLRIFHFALRPGGYLVLGTSEVADEPQLFRTLDKKLSLYSRIDGEAAEPRLPVFPISRKELAPADSGGGSIKFQAIHGSMAAEYSPPSALVGPDGQIVYLSEHAGRYLEHPGGRLTTSVTKLVRQELALELMAALNTVAREKRPTRSNPVPVRFNGDSRAVVLHVRPAVEPNNRGFNLVIFEELSDEAPAGTPESADRDAARATDDARELEITRERLHALVREYESGQEEMKVANEELQSANEELRSTMEELETSKEELESMNEELHTVNQENQLKVEELALLSNDLQNLLTSTDIATLFLDREMRIQRYTPRIGDVFNIRATDRGRPVSDLTHRLNYPELRPDAELVLRQLAPIEREVQDESGHWYLTRLLPYRSADDHIQGVVITFIDITPRKTAEERIIQLTKSLEHRVAERTRQVRELTTSLVRAEQRERRRLSAILHDQLQQLLYAVQLKLHLARERAAAERHDEAEAQLQQAEKLLGEGTRLTRHLSVDLNPPILKNEGMKGILGWLQGQMRELHGLDVRVDAEQEILVADPDVRVLLFQIFRELLFNVAKHADAKSAVVTLGEADGELRFSVSDRGNGFDVGAALENRAAGSSLGLRNARERIGLLGGHMRIESQPGLGTSVVLRMPKSATIGHSAP